MVGAESLKKNRNEARNAHFPSIGSDDPHPPLGVENVKIQENSEKIRGPPGGSQNDHNFGLG